MIFGTPYKLFKDLKRGDSIFEINYETLEIYTLKVSNITLIDISDSFSKNRIKVEMELSSNERKVELYDGNSYVFANYVGYQVTYFTTDIRIAKIMIELLEARNKYQWDKFINIFGSPLAEYSKKDVIIS